MSKFTDMLARYGLMEAPDLLEPDDEVEDINPDYEKPAKGSLMDSLSDMQHISVVVFYQGQKIDYFMPLPLARKLFKLPERATP